MKRATLVGLLALAVAALLALPGSALAKGHGHHGTHANRGNHCGQGHVKHSKKVGHSCQKLSRHSTGGAVNPGDQNQAGDNDQDEAGDNDQDEAGDNDQDEAGDDQGDVDDDQGDDGEDD
jgi:hypothetical protein